MSPIKLLLNQKYVITFLLTLFISCGSFSPTNLVSSDGIYEIESQEVEGSKSTFYQNYFENKKIEFENKFNLNDSESDTFINSSDISYSNSSPGWGQIPDDRTYTFDLFDFGYYNYYNRYFGYRYYNGYGFYNRFNRWYYPYYYPYYSYNWNPFYDHWYPYYYPYRFYRYNWYNQYGYYGSNIYNKANPNISYSVGARSSINNSNEYFSNRKSLSNNQKSKTKINYNNGRSNQANSSNQYTRPAREFDIIVLRRDGSSEIVRNYQTKFNRNRKVDEKTQITGSSNWSSNSTGSVKTNSSNWNLSGRNYNSTNSTRYNVNGNRSESYKTRSNSVRSYPNPSGSKSSNNSSNSNNYSTTIPRTYSSPSSSSIGRSYNSSSSPSTSRSSSSSSGRGSR